MQSKSSVSRRFRGGDGALAEGTAPVMEGDGGYNGGHGGGGAKGDAAGAEGRWKRDGGTREGGWGGLKMMGMVEWDGEGMEGDGSFSGGYDGGGGGRGDAAAMEGGMEGERKGDGRDNAGGMEAVVEAGWR